MIDIINLAIDSRPTVLVSPSDEGCMLTFATNTGGNAERALSVFLSDSQVEELRRALQQKRGGCGMSEGLNKALYQAALILQKEVRACPIDVGLPEPEYIHQMRGQCLSSRAKCVRCWYDSLVEWGDENE